MFYVAMVTPVEYWYLFMINACRLAVWDGKYVHVIYMKKNVKQ